MRSILESVDAFGIRIRSGYKVGYAQLAITAAQTIVEPAPYLLAYDPGATTRVITLPVVTVADNGLSHEVLNISTGAGNLTINTAAAATIGTVQPGGFAELKVINGVWVAFIQQSGTTTGTGQKTTLSQYILLPSLATTAIIGVNVPFPFTLTAVRFRPRVPVSTAAKLATLTAGIASTGTGALTNVTGGVVSLTSANCGTTNVPVAGTAVTAANTGIAGATVGVTPSAITAFLEGDGTVEWDVTNTS